MFVRKNKILFNEQLDIDVLGVKKCYKLVAIIYYNQEEKDILEGKGHYYCDVECDGRMLTCIKDHSIFLKPTGDKRWIRFNDEELFEHDNFESLRTNTHLQEDAFLFWYSLIE